MRLVFFFYLFLKVEQVPSWKKMNILINKNNENNIEDYIAYLISNLSNGDIHL